MIRTSRRETLKGALAIPAVGALPQWQENGRAVLLHDPSLAAGRRMASAARANGDEVLAIAGDRIRFARAVFERRPALVIGVSRHADALLIEEVGREAGYVPVSQSLDARFGWALAPKSDRGA
jgi:hypothetical protein